MSTTNFGRGHAAQAQEAPVQGSGDGYRLRSRSVDASAKVGNRRPTPVRYPKGQESTLDTEIELRNVIEQQNLTPVTHVDTQNITLAENENLTIVQTPVRDPSRCDQRLKSSASVTHGQACHKTSSMKQLVNGENGYV